MIKYILSNLLCNFVVLIEELHYRWHFIGFTNIHLLSHLAKPHCCCIHLQCNTHYDTELQTKDLHLPANQKEE